MTGFLIGTGAAVLTASLAYVAFVTFDAPGDPARAPADSRVVVESPQTD